MYLFFDGKNGGYGGYGGVPDCQELIKGQRLSTLHYPPLAPPAASLRVSPIPLRRCPKPPSPICGTTFRGDQQAGRMSSRWPARCGTSYRECRWPPDRLGSCGASRRSNPTSAGAPGPSHRILGVPCRSYWAGQLSGTVAGHHATASGTIAPSAAACGPVASGV